MDVAEMWAHSSVGFFAALAQLFARFGLFVTWIALFVGVLADLFARFVFGWGLTVAIIALLVSAVVVFMSLIGPRMARARVITQRYINVSQRRHLQANSSGARSRQHLVFIPYWVDVDLEGGLPAQDPEPNTSGAYSFAGFSWYHRVDQTLMRIACTLSCVTHRVPLNAVIVQKPIPYRFSPLPNEENELDDGRLISHLPAVNRVPSEVFRSVITLCSRGVDLDVLFDPSIVEQLDSTFGFDQTVSHETAMQCVRRMASLNLPSSLAPEVQYGSVRMFEVRRLARKANFRSFPTTLV
jgi:hypothetical protein